MALAVYVPILITVRLVFASEDYAEILQGGLVLKIFIANSILVFNKFVKILPGKPAQKILTAHPMVVQVGSVSNFSKSFIFFFF